MREALARARISPSAVDYINAHGTSTPLNDKFETEAIKQVFKEHAYKLQISSTKSMTGHLLGAAGGIEGVFATMSVKTNQMPPTINLDNPDPDCDLDYIPNKARSGIVNIAMSNFLVLEVPMQLLLCRNIRHEFRIFDLSQDCKLCDEAMLSENRRHPYRCFI